MIFEYYFNNLFKDNSIVIFFFKDNFKINFGCK